MSRVRTSRSATTKRVQHLQFRLTDAMLAASGEVAMGAPGYRFCLCSIPANALVTSVVANVLTASNDTATATAVVGTLADPDGFIAAVAPKTAGVKTGSGALINTITSAATKVYYTNTTANADATQGEILVTVEYLELGRADEVTVLGIDSDKYDAVAV